MKYTIYKDEVKSKLFESLINKKPTTPPIVSINKTVIDNISSFLTGIKIEATFDDELKINFITKLNTKIKPCINNKIGALTQKFNIRASYVATTEKKIVNRVVEFYKNVKDIKKEHEDMLTFDISHETNLQRVIDKESNTDKKENIKQEKTINHIEKKDNDDINKLPTIVEKIKGEQNNKINEIQPTRVFEKNKNINTISQTNNSQENSKSSLNIIILGAIAAILIVFVSILIGIKIMEMS